MADVGDFDTIPCDCPAGVPLVFSPGVPDGHDVGDFDSLSCDCPTPVADTSKVNSIIILASERRRQGGLNREAVVLTTPTSSTFTYKAADQNYLQPYTTLAGGKVTSSKAPDPVPGVPGPYLYDPKGGLAVTGVVATLNQNLSLNHSYPSIALNTNQALLFPDEVGYLAFNFGFSGVVAPVKYLGRLDNNHLLLDANFKFPVNVRSGVTVTLLAGRTPFQPEPGQTAGSFYLTGSAAGRMAAEAAVDDTVGAGLNVKTRVIFPGDRGLGGEGFPTHGAQKLSDIVEVFGGDELNSEIPKLRQS